MALILPLLALGGAIILAIFEYIIKPAFLSPLSKIPAPHWSCHVSPLWLLWAKWARWENRLVYENHMRKGKALRLSPNTLSLNCFEGGLKQIYLGGFPKTEFYWRGFANYGTENIFTFEDNPTHSARKRLISGVFSKSNVIASPTARASTKLVLYDRLLPMLYKAAKNDEPLEVLGMNFSYSMDSFIGWQFGCGLASNFLEDEEERRMYLDGFGAAAPYVFWQYEFPSLNTLLKSIGWIPSKVDSGFHDLEAWNLEKCDKAHELLAQGEDTLAEENKPVVMALQVKAMSDINTKPKEYANRMKIASDMFAHNSAAHETSGITLTYCLYELSLDPKIQTKLREELLTLDQPLTYPIPEGEDVNLPAAKAVDALPYLEAVIMETLRLYPAVAGGQPRRVPKPCSLGGYDNIQPGTIVQCYAYSLHRTPEVFPEPEKWRPERWIEATPQQLSEMRRWFWAFGSGGRMCVGSHFAYYSMKHCIASIYTNFTTTIHTHGDMELEDKYLAGPKGHNLKLNFHVV